MKLIYANSLYYGNTSFDNVPLKTIAYVDYSLKVKNNFQLEYNFRFREISMGTSTI